LRVWHRGRMVSESVLAMLLATLLTAVGKVSNTQGTYHDFPRGEQDPRARLALALVPPALDGLLAGTGGHLLGVERDSLEFIAEVPEHKVIYIDPPYNFRQYTAYYFLINVLARYVEIDDLEGYFGGVRYVRGQNPGDDFTSTFSRPRLFLESLEQLISRAKAEWVVLSYFNGRNHWGEFKADAGGPGYAKIESLFASQLFRSGSQEVIPITRTNYQSYGGYRAKPVEEHLFIAEKSR
jgi:adenine-specific DNA-methyltransferase